METVKHDTKDRIFYIGKDQMSAEAEMTYRLRNTSLIIDHTFVDPAQRGKGIAQKLFNEAEAFAESQGFQLEATCSFAVRMLERKK